MNSILNINRYVNFMYLIIIEGTDNIGKDTLISRLIEDFETVTLIHCGSPKCICFTSHEQDTKFIKYANNIKNGLYDNTDVIIMNRSHIGEYVYGQLYRKRGANNIKTMLDKVESRLKSRSDLVIKYVQLVSSSKELRKCNDDNKSLSKMNDELMNKENELFLEVFDYINLDKKLIYVNDEDNFLPKEEIYKEVIDFINE